MATDTRPDSAVAATARRRWLLPAATILVFVAIGGWLGGIGDLSDVQRNDTAAYLPTAAESTVVLAQSKRFTGLESSPAILVYTKPSAITDADRVQLVLATLHVASQTNMSLAGPPRGPIISDDGRAAEIIVPFMGSEPERIRPLVDLLRSGIAEVDGFQLSIAGPAAAQTDLIEVYGAINVVLLLVTLGLLLVILVAVYRSPILPIAVLAVAGTALGMVHGTAFLLAKAGVLTISGQVQGILDVLVLGAGTDYALLLVARYREELRRHESVHEAMRAALRAVRVPVAASGGTVVLGLLCLLASGLPSTRALGPVAAIGIAYAVVAMLTLLPAILVLLGRVAFWPRRPAFGSTPVEERGAWATVARRVAVRPRVVWVAATLALGAACLGLVRLESDGVPRTESFLTDVPSVAAQGILTEHFPRSSDTPTVIVANADRLDQTIAAARAVPGVTEVEAYVDPLLAFERRRAGQDPPGPKVLDGLARIEVDLSVPSDSSAATEVVRGLRDAVAAVPGADARVGGYAAGRLDVRDAASRDRQLIIPLILALVLGVLMLLLRAIVVPLLLVATVVLSYVATLGVCGVIFTDVLGFAGAEPSFPLLAFVFLVALGIDYNIFLMTRVREETAARGHRAGTIAALAVTGGVITSAGVVLAATFAALWVVPLVYLAELAFAVAFGVLLDTLVVRSLLVPALTLDIGPRSWWPSRRPMAP